MDKLGVTILRYQTDPKESIWEKKSHKVVIFNMLIRDVSYVHFSILSIPSGINVTKATVLLIHLVIVRLCPQFLNSWKPNDDNPLSESRRCLQMWAIVSLIYRSPKPRPLAWGEPAGVALSHTWMRGAPSSVSSWCPSLTKPYPETLSTLLAFTGRPSCSWFFLTWIFFMNCFPRLTLCLAQYVTEGTGFYSTAQWLGHCVICPVATESAGSLGSWKNCEIIPGWKEQVLKWNEEVVIIMIRLRISLDSGPLLPDTHTQPSLGSLLRTPACGHLWETPWGSFPVFEGMISRAMCHSFLVQFPTSFLSCCPQIA